MNYKEKYIEARAKLFMLEISRLTTNQLKEKIKEREKKPIPI